MAIKADYITAGREIKGATFRITRIWMSKQEGFNAWVGVFTDNEIPDEQFSVNAQYVEGQNPFDALYSAVAKLSFVQNPVHDVVTSLNQTRIEDFTSDGRKDKGTEVDSLPELTPPAGLNMDKVDVLKMDTVVAEEATPVEELKALAVTPAPKKTKKKKE